MNMKYMRRPADMALAARSAKRAAKAAKRQQLDQQRLDFRRFSSPGGFQVTIPLKLVPPTDGRVTFPVVIRDCQIRPLVDVSCLSRCWLAGTTRRTTSLATKWLQRPISGFMLEAFQDRTRCCAYQLEGEAKAGLYCSRDVSVKYTQNRNDW